MDASMWSRGGKPGPAGETAAFAAFLLASVLLFLPAITAPPAFLCDDYTILSTLVKDGHLDAGRMAAHLTHTFHGLSGRYYRPVFYLSYALDFFIAGARPAFYVFMNALYHGAAAWFLLRFLQRIGAARGFAAAAAVIFLCHPIHVEAVAWIAGRTSSLAGMCFLGALACFAGFRNRPTLRSLGGMAVLFGLGLLTREEGVVLPLLFAAVDLLARPAPAEEGRGDRTHPRRAFLLPYGTALSMAAGYWIARTRVLGAGASAAGEVLAGLFRPERWPVLFASLSRYGVPLSAGAPGGEAAGVRAAAAALTAALLLLGTAALRDRSRRRIWGFGLILFVAASLPSLPVLQVDANLLNARCFYFPSAGFAVLLAAGVETLRLRWGRGLRGAAAMKGCLVLLLAAAVLPAILNQVPFKAAAREARAFLRAVRNGGYDVVVVPRFEYFPYADREGDGVLDDEDALFVPSRAPAAAPPAAAPPAGLAVLVDVPRARRGVYLFWGGLDRALLPLFGRPPVNVLYTEMYTDREPGLAPDGSFMGPLVRDGVPVLKWTGERLLASVPEVLGPGSPAGREIHAARAVPSLGRARSLDGYTFPAAAFHPRIVLPAGGPGEGGYRYRVLSPFGTRVLPAEPRREGDRLLFDPWNEEGAGTLFRAAARLRGRTLPGGTGLHDFQRLGLVLYIERVEGGRVKGRSTPLCFRLDYSG